MRLALKICWFLALSQLLLPLCVHAQEQEPEAVPAAPTVTAPIPAAPTTEPDLVPVKPWLSEGGEPTVAPDVYLLPDESGKLRKVLGFKYEDFLKAWSLNRSEHGQPLLQAARPRYAIDSWKISGNVEEKYAQLRVEFRLTVSSNGWTDIPLQMKAFIVQKLTIKDQVEGECLVFDEQRHGHVLWLSGKTGQQRTLVLEGLARLKTNTGSQGIELHVPRATTSEFILRVPNTFTRFEKSPESTLTTTTVDKNTIDLELVGQANPLLLRWKPLEVKAVNKASLIEVEGRTKIQLDRRQILYATTLEINSFDRPLGQVQIRLPRGAKLVSDEGSDDYVIRKVGTPSSPDEGQVVSVLRAKPQTAPWSLRLSAEASWDPSGDLQEHFVEGFEVIDAFRQSGTVLLEVDNRLQSYFDIFDDIDQIRVPNSSLPSKGRSILGNFRYSRFPWHLEVYTSQRQRRVKVLPKYDLLLNAEEARLTVTGEYQFTGAEIFRLRVDLQGWTSTDAPIDSGGRIDPDGIVFRNNGNLILPLVDPSTQNLRLSLNLRKEMQLGENVFVLPNFLDAIVDDGELIVDSSESLSVVPKFSELVGLNVISKAVSDVGSQGSLELETNQERIHLRTSLAQPTFVADVKYRKRQVTAVGQTSVEMDQQLIRVQQRLDFTSKYRPVSELTLSLPEAMWMNDTLVVSLNGERLPVDLEASPGEEDFEENSEVNSQSLLQMRVTLPRPMQNEIPLDIEYEVPAPDLSDQEWTPIRLPLAAPLDSISHHSAVIKATQPVLVTANQRLNSDAWQVLTEKNRIDTTDADALQIQTKEKLSHLFLRAQIDLVEKDQWATLERAWIQSWVAAGQRQDRAVFRFRSAYTTVIVQLPQGLDHTEIEVLLDHVPQAFEILEGNRLAVMLLSSEHHASHTLELRYQIPTSLPSWGELKLSLPRLECHEFTAPIYWQLILPQSWLMTSSPERLNADYWLGWKNYRWGKQPTLLQADLEQSTYGVPADRPPELSTQYVFRAFEIPVEVHVNVLRQSWFFLLGTLVVFGVGLLYLYTPLLRSGFFWLGLACALLIGVSSYPELILLVIEVILAGGLLVFSTSLLRRVFVAKNNRSEFADQRPLDPLTEITESWQQHRLTGGRESDVHSETTATLRTDRHSL